jgi:molybdenum cofactor biosynthesis protein B
MSESSKRHKLTVKKKLNFGILICSTSRYNQLKNGYRIKDASGDLIEKMVDSAGYKINFRKIISDNKVLINNEMKNIIESKDIDVGIFCGGTGISRSDVTIESISPFLEKKLPGFGEIFRFLSFHEMGSATILSRTIAGIANGKAVFCIPGSPDAVKLCFEKLILPEVAHIVRHARE